MARPSLAFDVHPDNFAPSSLSTKVFDVIAIGSGWAGRVACGRLHQAGLSALIIENELIGGDCPFWACVPSKVLLRPQQVLQAVHGVLDTNTLSSRTEEFAQETFSRRDRFTGQHSDATLLVPMMEAAGVVMARGIGSIVGEKKVRIVPNRGGDSVEVEARRAVILATGSEPIYPVVSGIHDVNAWTPRDATSSSVVPRHLVILGAGAVGTEMAAAYVSFGSRVTLISSSDEILPFVDDEAGRIVREALGIAGVDVKLSTKAVSVRRHGESINVELKNGDVVEGSELLIATGRRPKSSALNLSAVGITVDHKGNIPVNESLQVAGLHWLYAGGDVNGRALLTHMSKYHGRIVAKTILEGRSDGTAWSATSATADRLATPQIVFTHPPVASVGLTRKSAQAKGVKTRAITAPFASLGARIASDDAAEGWAQWLVDENNVLVGATLVGSDADNLLQASTVGIVGGLTLDRLAHAIPCFPSASEVYLNLMEAAGF